MSSSFPDRKTGRSRDTNLDKLLLKPIAEVRRHLDSNSTSAVELCKQALEAARFLDSALGGYSQLIESSALDEARDSDARRKTGQVRSPLDGIPIAVKDLIDTRPAICRAGLHHLDAYVPSEDAAVVAALRRAGAVIIGVTETDPGAFSTDTPRTINPLAPGRTVGGSSGGSAAIVAAGLAFAAIGTDTGGSIRIPAACCSILGFKPSWGRVDTTGVRPLAPSSDHVGPLARSVDDLTIVQSILDPALDPHPEHVGPLRLGTSEGYYADAAPDVQASIRAALSLLRARGAIIRDVKLPDPDEALAFHMVTVAKQAADYHSRSFPDDWPAYPDIARATVDAGIKITAAEYASAEAQGRAAAEAVNQALLQVDALILPTMPVDAPLRDMQHITLGRKLLTKLEATIRYTALFNQTGHPVIAMPAILLPDGRALSVQLVGAINEDAALLALARRIETLLSVGVDYAGLVSREAGNARRVRSAMN